VLAFPNQVRDKLCYAKQREKKPAPNGLENDPELDERELGGEG